MRIDLNKLLEILEKKKKDIFWLEKQTCISHRSLESTMSQRHISKIALNSICMVLSIKPEEILRED